MHVTKYKFSLRVLHFLGYHISRDGFSPTENKIQFFKTLQPPATIAALRCIIGSSGFYRQFVNKAAKYLAPFNELLKGHTKKNDQSAIAWTEKLINTVDKAKVAFSKFTLLRYYKIILTCDVQMSQ